MPRASAFSAILGSGSERPVNGLDWGRRQPFSHSVRPSRRQTSAKAGRARMRVT